MTKSVTINDTEFAGAMKVRIADVDITSYTNGGEGFTPSDMGMHRFQFVSVFSTENGYLFTYDYTNEQILAYEAGADGAALDEVADTTDVGTTRVMAFGR